MGLHRVRTRLRKELAEHEEGTRDWHEPTAEAHRVFGAHVADDLAAVEAAIEGADAIEKTLRDEIAWWLRTTLEEAREAFRVASTSCDIIIAGESERRAALVAAAEAWDKAASAYYASEGTPSEWDAMQAAKRAFREAQRGAR